MLETNLMGQKSGNQSGFRVNLRSHPVYLLVIPKLGYYYSDHLLVQSQILFNNKQLLNILFEEIKSLAIITNEVMITIFNTKSFYQLKHVFSRFIKYFQKCHHL